MDTSTQIPAKDSKAWKDLPEKDKQAYGQLKGQRAAAGLDELTGKPKQSGVATEAKPRATSVEAGDEIMTLTPTDIAWGKLMKLVAGVSLAECEQKSLECIRIKDVAERTSTCTLAAAAAMVHKKAYMEVVQSFPDSKFKRNILNLHSAAGGLSDTNFSALNGTGWLVFSSKIPLILGFRERMVAKVGGDSWSAATFANFSTDKKTGMTHSGQEVAKIRRDHYGLENIKQAEARVIAEAAKQ